MSRELTGLEAGLADYIGSLVPDDGPVARALRERTASLPMARMQISPEQAQFMRLLLRLIGARQTIEIGVFTGYSTLITAECLPADGRVVACDVSKEWTDIGRQHWQRAGVAERIDLRLAPAAETLSALIDDGQAGEFDFAFIDADKTGYAEYYELCLQLVRPGGLIAVDNALWGGSVIDPARDDADTVAIRELNRRIADDERVDSCLAACGDGLHLARRIA